jgi:ABC-2 type transport system permease protein
VTVEVLAMAGRRLRQLRRSPGRLLGVTLSPLVSLVVLGYLFRDTISVGGGNYQEYLFAGAAIQVGLAGIGPTALAVAADLRTGAFDRFRSLPISRAAVPLGHTAGDFLLSLAALGVVVVVGVLLGWRSHTGLVPTLQGFAVVIVFSYVMLWVGVLFGSVLRNIESIGSVTQFLVVVLPFFSNAFLPSSSLPAVVRPIAEWNPISAVMALCRELWGNGAGSGSALLVAAVTLLVLLAASLAVSVRRFATAG